MRPNLAFPAEHQDKSPGIARRPEPLERGANRKVWVVQVVDDEAIGAG